MIDFLCSILNYYYQQCISDYSFRIWKLDYLYSSGYFGNIDDRSFFEMEVVVDVFDLCKMMEKKLVGLSGPHSKATQHLI